MRKERAGSVTLTDYSVSGSTGSLRVSEKSGRLSSGGKGKRKVVVANGIIVKDERVAAANPLLEKLDYAEGERKLRPSVIRYHGTGATLYEREKAIGLDVPESVRIAGAKQVSSLGTAAEVAAFQQRTGSYSSRDYYRTFKSRPDPRDRIAREQASAEMAAARSAMVARTKRLRLKRKLVTQVWS